jgi:hypothetical protein
LMVESRYAVFWGQRYRLVATAGLGVGHNAEILHRDLTAGPPVIPAFFAGLENSWRIGPVELGVRLSWFSLSTAHLALACGWAL